jgi:hypothetical protein
MMLLQCLVRPLDSLAGQGVKLGVWMRGSGRVDGDRGVSSGGGLRIGCQIKGSKNMLWVRDSERGREALSTTQKRTLC